MYAFFIFHFPYLASTSLSLFAVECSHLPQESNGVVQNTVHAVLTIYDSQLVQYPISTDYKKTLTQAVVKIICVVSWHLNPFSKIIVLEIGTN